MLHTYISPYLEGLILIEIPSVDTIYSILYAFEWANGNNMEEWQ